MEQRRDNWSRDQVRALRRRLKNLKAELSRQAMGTAYGRGRLAKWRKEWEHATTKARRLEATTIRHAEELAWYRERLEAIVKQADVYLGDPNRWGGAQHGLESVRMFAQHALTHPLYSDQAAPRSEPR